MASNVYLEKTHIEQFLEGDLDFGKIEDNKSLTLSSTKSHLISQMLRFLKSINISETKLKPFLNTIKIIRQTPIKYFDFKIVFKNENMELTQKNFCLKILKVFRHLISNYTQLTSKEKSDFCETQREIMKVYLNSIISKREESHN
ncbi:MAG: hypothetical protein P8Y70_08360 [Candidatus Lokiarchaeota archaeon]